MERGHTPTEAALLRFVIKLRYFAEYWHHLLLIKQMAELKRVSPPFKYQGRAAPLVPPAKGFARPDEIKKLGNGRHESDVG
jgi:hypothetical protein